MARRGNRDMAQAARSASASGAGAPSSPVVRPDQLFATPLVAPSYSRGLKFLLLAMLAQMAYMAWTTQPSWAKVSWQLWLLIVLALVPIVSWSWYILTGKTTIDSRGIRRDVPFNQSGNDLRWHEIAAVRFLDWPLGSRLVVKTQAPGAARAFHAGNQEARQAFRRLQALYRSPR